MVKERFKGLIKYLASCNGNGQKELDLIIDIGKITKEEALLVFYYSSIQKLNNKLDRISEKVISLSEV